MFKYYLNCYPEQFSDIFSGILSRTFKTDFVILIWIIIQNILFRLFYYILSKEFHDIQKISCKLISLDLTWIIIQKILSVQICQEILSRKFYPDQ